MIIRSILVLGLVSMGSLAHFDAASVPALPKLALQQQVSGTWQKTALNRLNDMKGEFKATQNNIMVEGDKADLNRIADAVRTSLDVR